MIADVNLPLASKLCNRHTRDDLFRNEKEKYCVKVQHTDYTEPGENHNL